MPNINVLKSSRFLKKEDCGQGILLTIKGCTEENMAKEGAPEELRWCLHFVETDKPFVLNSTNGQIIAGFIGNDNTDNWVGHKVVLYNDPSISFGGKLTGGIRARAPRNQPKPAQAPPVQTAPPATPPWPTELPKAADDSDIPF